MAIDLVDLTEPAQWYGSDLQLSATGDLALVGVGAVSQVTKSNQRVLRRLCTNAGDYLDAVSYGAGLPSRIGDNLDVAKLQALVSGQMQLEGSVQQSPPPSVTVTPFPEGAQINARYVVAGPAIPAVLSFSTEA